MSDAKLRANLNKAESELTAAGWNHIATLMTGGNGLKYGALYTKDGVRFYLNKDTVMPTMTGPDMAKACVPLFN